METINLGGEVWLKPKDPRRMWDLWDSRFKEQSWKLLELIDWVSHPEEWGGITGFPAKDVPKDMLAYKNELFNAVLNGIKNGLLKVVYDRLIGDHYVMPVQILLFLQKKDFHIPLACRSFLDRAQREEFSSQVDRLVKRKKLKVRTSATDPKKERSDRLQKNRFLEEVKTSIAKDPPGSYDALFNRPEITAVMHSMIDAKGRPKEYDRPYLKRWVSKFMPESAKRPGCRRK